MTYLSFSGFINCVISFALAALFLARGTRSEINLVFSLYCLSISFWAANLFVMHHTAFSPWTLFSARTMVIAAVFISQLHFHFWVCATKQRNRMTGWLKAAYASSFLQLPFIFSPLFVRSVEPVGPIRQWVIAGPLYVVNLVILLFFFVMSARLQILKFRESAGRQRKQMLLALIASCLAYLGALMLYVPTFRIPVPLWWLPLYSIYVLFMAYTALQQDLLELTLALRSGVVYSLLWMLVGIPFAALTWWVTRSGGGAAVGFIAPLAGYFLIGKLKQAVADTVSRLPLFRGRFGRFQDVQKLKDILRNVQSAEELARAVVQTILYVLKPRSVSVMLFDGSSQSLTRRSSGGAAPAEATHLDPESPLIQALAKGGALVREALEDIVPAHMAGPVQREMEILQAEVSVPMFGADGRVEGVVNIGRREDGTAPTDLDVLTAWDCARAAEEALREIGVRELLVKQERLAAIGQMAFVVSHEMKVPLAAIQSSTHILEGRLAGSPDPMMLKHVGVVQSQALSLGGIISGIMDFANDRKLRLESIDLEELIRETAAALSLPDGVRVDLRLAGVPHGLFDREAMKRTFLNLFHNSLQAMDGAGALTVQSTMTDADQVEITVSDTGCGISPEHLPKIFEPFFTTKSNGTGLGMAVVMKAVEQHRGDIRVQSVVGKGTTFVLSLPLRQEADQE